MTHSERDPRLSADQLRTVEQSSGTITLVGVVHDHPASRFRASAVVEDREPDVLAVELPPLALPLFEQYARDQRSPPVFGGEMSAAIQAATTDRVVGIDGPTPGFCGRLLRELYRTNASLETTRNVFSGFLSATKHAAVCRAASVVTSVTGIRLEVDAPASYEADVTDDPRQQAVDEQDHLDRARSILDVLEPHHASQLRDSTREAYMAETLDSLDDDVVAIVGQDHLDPITARLEADTITK
jgi:pheromone shutdown protein TraB